MKKIVAFAAGERPLVDPGVGNLVSGPVYAANASRFVDAHYNEPLTQYVTGIDDEPGLQELLDFLAPSVPVPPRFSFKKTTASESFFSETDDIRGIGADFKQVEYSGSESNERTYNKGLCYRLDLDEEDSGILARERIVRLLRTRILRNDARRAAALLISTASNTAKTWGSSADPDADLDLLLDNAGDAAGIEPNRVLFGRSAWRLRRSSYTAQDTAGAFAGAGMTPEALAMMMGLERILVSRHRYQSTASAKAKLVASYVVAFFGDPVAGKDDPSTLKRFVSETAGGGLLRVYEQQVSAKILEITVEHHSNIVATNTAGCLKYTVS